MLPPLLRWSFWFSPYAVPFIPTINVLLPLLMLMLFVGGLAVWIYARRTKSLDKMYRRVWKYGAQVSIWAGIVGLLLYVMTWQAVPYLSMRAWFIAWLVLFGWLAWRTLNMLRHTIPSLKAQDAERAAYEKWLPKPKK